MNNVRYLTQHVFGKRIDICLILSLVICFSFAEMTYGYDSFEIGTGAWEGLSIREGLVVLDPTVITIIIGEDAMEIEIISSPNIEKLFAFSPPVDILFGLTTDPNHPIEVVAERIAGMAMLKDTAFEDVTDDLLATLDFTERTVKIDSNDIVVLLLNQDQEEYAMLSNIRKYPDATVRLICWREGTEIPEVSTLVLLSVGIGFLIGMMKRKQHNRSRKGGRCMKHIKTLLFALVLLPLLVGTAMAAELRIITKGTGYGSVIGERILCPDICKQTYEEGTVVQLKAVPFSDSRFGGWLIDGEPHEGVITIEKDTVVTAIFELIAGLDELTVYWYNGSVKEQATIATDEMVVFLEDREQWGATTKKEYWMAEREIVQQFHPEADITDADQTIMFLKSPVALTKEQWFSALSALKEMKYVRYAGPILYQNLEERWDPLIPTEQISVQFPASYTENQILAIEEEYGLIRQGTRILASETFYYYQASTPLEAIDIANRLYESGKAEYARPNISERLLPSAIPNDEYFAKKPPHHYQEQWHLNNTQYPGEDINVLAAWDLKDTAGNLIRGSGVIIAVIDDGVEIDPISDDGLEIGHEDLQPNAEKIVNIDGQEVHVKDLNYDFIEGDHYPLDNGVSLPPGVHLDPDITCRDPDGCHGTAVSGIIGGVGFNSIGICGVAPESNIIGHRLLGAWFTDIQIYIDALTRNNDIIHIYNNSWGRAKMLRQISKDILKALKDGIDNGRNGKGNIYVFAGGNTRRRTAQGMQERIWNSNGDNYANSRYTIAVTSSDQQGKHLQAPGANILVNAPGVGIVTTDRTGNRGYNYEQGFSVSENYWKIHLGQPFEERVPWDIRKHLAPLTGQRFANENEFLTAIHECLKIGLKEEQGLDEEQIEALFNTYKDKFLKEADFQTSNPDLSTNYCSFGGTSAAAPVVSGVVALMLQMKPELGWRDVQHILIETAEKNDPTDDDWIENAAGYHFNHKYGAGRVDATAAVELARDWIPLTERGMEEVEELNIGWGMGDFERDEGISDSISMGKFEGNLRIEYVEVTFTSAHPQWTDLEVTLISPEGTKSVLIEPHDPPVQGKFSAWNFGSARHFGESSQGDWELAVKDLRKGNGQNGTKGFLWVLKIYGTELPPYVQAVEARSGDELIYSAEWIKEEDGQLEFVESVEPQHPSNTTPLHLTIVTSEAMQWLSLTLFDKDFSSKEGPSKIQQADDTGTVWEVTLDSADFPQEDVGDENTLANVYPLTITGQDRGDLYLLPFADRSPKTLPTHPSEADWPDHPNAGDSVHQLGKILSEPFQWSIMMPTPGTCDYDFDRGGIECTFDEGAGFALTEFSWQAFRDAGVPETVVNSLQNLQGQRFPTEQDFLEAVHAHLGDAHTAQYLSLILEHAETARGRVIVHSKDVVTIDPTIQYVIIGSVGQNSSTWDGTYQVPTQSSGELEVGLTWEPQEAWFPFREPSPDQQELWCAENPPDYKPNEPKGPPASEEDTATLQWAIRAEPNPDNKSCQVRVTWETEEVAEEARTLLLDLQPQRLCEAFQDQTGTVEATTTYPWDIVDRLEYTGCHIVDEQPEHFENVKENGVIKYVPIPTWEKVLEPGQCRSWYTAETMFRFDPERWPSQPPQDTPFPTSLEEGDIAIHYDCQWYEGVSLHPVMVVLINDWNWTDRHHCSTVYVDGEGRQEQYVGGYICDQTITHLTWECGDQCTYQELPGEFVPPVPVLECELSLGP